MGGCTAALRTASLGPPTSPTAGRAASCPPPVQPRSPTAGRAASCPPPVQPMPTTAWRSASSPPPDQPRSPTAGRAATCPPPATTDQQQPREKRRPTWAALSLCLAHPAVRQERDPVQLVLQPRHDRP